MLELSLVLFTVGMLGFTYSILHAHHRMAKNIERNQKNLTKLSKFVKGKK